MKTFNKVFDLHKKHLEMYVPVVARVHGPTHPIFYKVQDQTNDILNKIHHNNYHLEENFDDLRHLTNNYEVPGDTCETYEAVYLMLKDLDDAFQADTQ